MFSKLIEHAVFFFFFITSYSIEFSWVITNVCHVNYHAPGENHPHWRHLDGHQGPFSDHWTSSTCKQFIFHAVPSIHLNFWTLFQAIGLRITLVILGFVLLQRNEIKRRKFIIQFHFDYKYLSSFSIINCPPNAAMKIDKQLIIQFITNNFH